MKVNNTTSTDIFSTLSVSEIFTELFSKEYFTDVRNNFHLKLRLDKNSIPYGVNINLDEVKRFRNTDFGKDICRVCTSQYDTSGGVFVNFLLNLNSTM